MRKKAILIISASFLVTIVYFAAFGLRTTRLVTMQKLVERNVKLGASPEDVIRFLDSQRLEHSDLIKPDFMTLGGRSYGNQNVIVAIKRHTVRALVWGEAIQLIFVFDENRRLVRSDVFPRYTAIF